MPDRGHAAHDGGADQHLHKRAMRGVEHADHALIARKQTGHHARRRRVHGKQHARHVDHAAQPGIAGHVDAVVVARAEVDGGEMPVLKLRRQVGVTAQQRTRAVAVRLGLENLVTLDRAQLADRAVDRAHVIGLGQRPNAGLERAGEEIVEAGVGRRVGFGRVRHVDAVALDELADDVARQRLFLRRGHDAPDRGHPFFRHQVLRQYGKAIKQGRLSLLGKRKF